MRATIKVFAGVALCLALSTAVMAGNILPNAGGVLAMGCVDTEDALGPTSQGLGCAGPDGEEYAYWQPIGAASGTAILAGNVLTITGQVCTDLECVGLGDQLVIMSNDGSTAEAIRAGEYLKINLRWKTSGGVQVGGAALGYLIHSNDLN